MGGVVLHGQSSQRLGNRGHGLDDLFERGPTENLVDRARHQHRQPGPVIGRRRLGQIGVNDRQDAREVADRPQEADLPHEALVGLAPGLVRLDDLQGNGLIVALASGAPDDGVATLPELFQENPRSKESSLIRHFSSG